MTTRLRIVLGAVLLFAGCAFAVPVHAQTQGLGAGGILSTSNVGAVAPVGLSVKSWLSDRSAITGATSFFIGDDETLSFWILQGDLLFHNFNELDVGEGFLALYVGPGIQFVIREDVENDVSLRGPLGISYLLGSAPVDVFAEVAPTLQLTDPTSLRFDGAIGFRYFFSGS
jgi:hypothetical protein